MKQFVVTYFEWSKTHKEYAWIYARDQDQARRQAYWILGDLIDIQKVEEYIEA